MDTSKSNEPWTCLCGYVGMYANSSRHLKTSRHNKRLFLKNNPPPVKEEKPVKLPKIQLTYLDKQRRAREIIDCPYCEMKSSRSTLKKHIALQHKDVQITSNYINHFL